MTELNDFQIDRLASNIVEHMLMDQDFMYDVAREWAEAWSLEEYNEWFQEEEETNDNHA